MCRTRIGRGRACPARGLPANAHVILHDRAGHIRPLREGGFAMLYALLMYPLAYFYLRGVMFPQSYSDWGMPVFAALFIVYVDCAARAAHRTAARETPIWAGCWLALSLTYIPAGRIVFSFITVTLSSFLIERIQRIGAPCAAAEQGA